MSADSPLPPSLLPRIAPSRAFWIRVAVAAVLLATVFLLQANLAKTFQKLSQAKPAWLAGMLVIAFSGEMITAFKLQFMMRKAGARPGFGLVYKSSLIAMFYNNLLPGSIGGDLARILYLARAAGGKALAAAAVFMQRNTGLAGLMLVAVIAAWLPAPFRLHRLAGALAPLDYPGVWFLLILPPYLAINAVLISDFLYALIWKRFKAVGPHGEVGAGQMQHSGFRKLLASVLRVLHRLHESVLHYRRGLVLAVALSAGSQLADSLLVWCAARALNIPLSYHFLCVCVPAVTLAALIPISFNGIGLRELVYVLFLRSIGVEPEAAVSLSLLHFGAQLCLSAAGGLLQVVGSGRDRD